VRGERLRIAREKARKHASKFPTSFWSTEEFKEKSIHLFRKTRVFCSDVCCGNPRRHKMKHNYKSHLTKQEILAEEELNWFEHASDEIVVLEKESMEIEDYLDGLRVGEEFYGDRD